MSESTASGAPVIPVPAAAPDAPRRAGRREWIGLAVLALPVLLLSIDVSVLYLALPKISEALHPSGTEQLWIMDVYGFLLAGFLVTMGTLGDRVGRRRLLLTGAAAFGVLSVVAAFSTSAPMLIAARAALGVAAATLMPSSMALISVMFTDPRQRGTALAAWTSCFMGGMVLGPVVGGTLLQHFGWGSAFLLGVPVMVALLAIGPFVLPEQRNPKAGRLDPLSVALSLAAVLPAVYGLKRLAHDGPAVLPVLAVAAGVLFAVLFARRQRRLPEPLLDLGLFRVRIFTGSLAFMLLTGIVMGGFSLVISTFLQLVLGLPTFAAGLWQVPGTVAMILGSSLAPVLNRRIRPGRLIAAGLALSAVGFGVASLTTPSTGPAPLAAALVVISLGMGPMMGLGYNLMLGAVPVARAGSAAAVSETSAEFGIAVGVATVGSLVAAVYRAAVTAGLPGGLPGPVAAAARESVAGARTGAATLPDDAARTVLAVAGRAYTDGLHVVTVVGVVVFLALAALALVLYRRLPATGPASTPEPATTGTDAHETEPVCIPA